MLARCGTSWPPRFKCRLAQGKHHDIAVSAATQYLPEQSTKRAGATCSPTRHPAQRRQVAAQLISATGSSPMRKAWCEECAAWRVGAQPLLEPGELRVHQRRLRSRPRGTMRAATRWSPRTARVRSADPGITCQCRAASLILVVTPAFPARSTSDERRERQAAISRMTTTLWR